MLILSLIFYLLSCAINLKKDLSILYSRILFLILLNSSLLCYLSLYLNNLSEGLGIFGGLFKITSLNMSFSLFILLTSIIINFLNSHYGRKILLNYNTGIYNKLSYNKTTILNTTSEQYKIVEYPLIMLFIIIGGIFLMGSNDTISLFLSIELQSYGLYILCTVYRNSESSTSAGLTYFLLGALASCFILLSTSILYANSGCTSLENLSVISSISEVVKEYNNENNTINWYSYYYLYISMIILSVGFLFKISAAPFHFWSPEVYDAVPTIVTTFISILPKITILIFFLDLVNNASISSLNYDWTSIFVISSILSLIIGTVLGLSQTRIKKLYAYSTISHLGFMLLCLSNKSRESIQAFVFYLTQYSISNLNSFFILIAIGYFLYLYVYKNNVPSENLKKEEYKYYMAKNLNIKELNNSPIQLIDQMKGLFYLNPFLSLSLAITLFSFAGVPPLIGFFAKLMVLSASISNGLVFMSIVAILTSVIGGVYYLVIIKKIFFETADYTLNTNLSDLKLHGKLGKDQITFNIKNIFISSSLTITISMLTTIILSFIFIPSESLNYISIISMILLDY